MSHFSSISTKICDLNIARKALENMGLELLTQAQCRYYYGSVRAENVVKLPGRYDMTLEKESDGTYRIVADFYNGDVENAIGDNGSYFLEQYAIEDLKHKVRQMHFSIMPNGEKNTFRIRDPQSSDGGYMIVTVKRGGKLSFKPKGLRGKSCAKFLKLEDALGTVEKREFTAEYRQSDMETVSEAERAKLSY